MRIWRTRRELKWPGDRLVIVTPWFEIVTFKFASNHVAVLCSTVQLSVGMQRKLNLSAFNFILWSSGKGQARIGKGWQSRRKASKLKPLPRAYTKVGCHPPPPPTTHHPKVRQTCFKHICDPETWSLVSSFNGVEGQKFSLEKNRTVFWETVFLSACLVAALLLLVVVRSRCCRHRLNCHSL